MMTRRSIFLLVATVVILYFSIILFMLNPLQGARVVYYGNGPIRTFRQILIPKLIWCKSLHRRYPPADQVVALASYPGSGNTWMRYLLQQATGVVTGSIYIDYGLKTHGFPAENVTDGTVLVVKTHEVPPSHRLLDKYRFHSVVLLIRNPRDAILADFNRLHKGHIGTAPKSAFTKKFDINQGIDWPQYVSMQLPKWEAFHKLWLTKFSGPIHIVFYEMLVKNTRETLQGVLDFLNYTITKEDMDCTIINKEGIYRRRKKIEDFDPFTPDMYRRLEGVRNNTIAMIAEYQRKFNNSVKRIW